MTRVGMAGLWHETNTYSARLTRLEDFAAFELLEGEEILARHAGTGTVIGGMLESDLALVPIATAGAWPAGRATADTMTTLLTRMETALRNAAPLDGLLLDLHGAMVAEGDDDVERSVVELSRRVVGDVPIAAVFDLHGNPSAEMAAGLDGVVVYDTYPHIDMRERGREAADIMSELLEGVRYRTLVRKVPILICPLAQGTDDLPMRDLESRARALERDAGLRRIALFPGFAYSDVARAGFTVVVTHTDGDEATARAAATELVELVHGHDWTLRRPDPATAVAEALDAPQPVVLADVADNIGGGSPGDGTALLAELLAQHAPRAVVTLADAAVAAEAARRGAGAMLAADVGGKTDKRHGEPVAVRGVVKHVSDGRYRSSGTWMTGRSFSMGTTAVVAVDGITVVVTERATPPFHSEQLTSLGIDPAEAGIIVAKGAIAWKSAFGDVARTVIEVDTPGICPVDPGVLERSAEPAAV